MIRKFVALAFLSSIFVIGNMFAFSEDSFLSDNNFIGVSKKAGKVTF